MNLFDLRVERNIDHRPYQQEFVKAFNDGLAEGHDRQLCVLPTGAGKTATAGEIVAQVIEGSSPLCDAQSTEQRALWTVHTRNLVQQARDALHKLYGMDGGIEMGNIRCRDWPLVFSTIQTMSNRVDKEVWPADHWHLGVIDEGHRALAPGYQKVFREYYECPVLGLTATPRRGDKQDLMSFYDNVAIDIKLSDLIHRGFLSPLTIANMPLGIDLSEVDVVAGDYDAESLGHAIEPYLESAAKQLAEYKGRRMLVYLPLISLSQQFAALCGQHGLRGVHVDGGTDREELEQAIAQLTEGSIDFISNSMLLTEGIDIPSADLILNLRPTRSWTLYVQICGRGTRLSPSTGKRDCVLLDPLWQCEDHSLLKRPASIVAKDDEEERLMTEKLEGGGDLIEAQGSAVHDRAEALKKKLERNRKRQKRKVDAIEFFSAIGDDELVDYEPIAPWESEEMSVPQREMLEKSGFDLDAVRGKGHASAIIGKIVDRGKEGLPTVKMSRCAIRLGMDKSKAWGSPFEEVRDYIEANKNW